MDLAVAGLVQCNEVSDVDLAIPAAAEKVSSVCPLGNPRPGIGKGPSYHQHNNNYY